MEHGDSMRFLNDFWDIDKDKLALGALYLLEEFAEKHKMPKPQASDVRYFQDLRRLLALIRIRIRMQDKMGKACLEQLSEVMKICDLELKRINDKWCIALKQSDNFIQELARRLVESVLSVYGMQSYVSN